MPCLRWFVRRTFRLPFSLVARCRRGSGEIGGMGNSSSVSHFLQLCWSAALCPLPSWKPLKWKPTWCRMMMAWHGGRRAEELGKSWEMPQDAGRTEWTLIIKYKSGLMRTILGVGLSSSSKKDTNYATMTGNWTGNEWSVDSARGKVPA